MKIFLSVGEPSGDLHGANFIRELSSISEEPIEFVGFGGPRMEREGCQLHTDLTQLAVMGIFPVIKMIPQFLKLARQAKDYFQTERPDAVVMIDFPGFNWHIAKHAKRAGIPVYYYGTPQLWAWASWRIGKMRRTVDHALCKLPFEESWLRERGVNATHVGHPYFDELTSRTLDDVFLASQQGQKPLVTILPGSRNKEVRDNFHLQLKAAEKITKQVPNVRFAVAAYKESQAERCRELICESSLNEDQIEVFVHRTPELIEAATCCIAVSGSVSLELLYHAKPTVIAYWVSPFAMWMQQFFRRVRYITLVNLLTAKELFPEKVGVYDPNNPEDDHVLMPEYLTCGDNSDDLAREVIGWLTDEPKRQEAITKLTALREEVGGGGASARAAEYFLKTTTQIGMKPNQAA